MISQSNEVTPQKVQNQKSLDFVIEAKRLSAF